MKHVLMLILAFIIVSVLWRVIASIVGPLLSAAIGIALLVGFCYAVYLVYKLLTREKQVY